MPHPFPVLPCVELGRIDANLARIGFPVRVVPVTAEGLPEAMADEAAATFGLERDRQERLHAMEALAEEHAGDFHPLVDALLVSPERLFGFWVNRHNVDLVCELTRRLKATRPRCLIVLFGPEARASASDLQLPWHDVVIGGAAEGIIVPLLQSLVERDASRCAMLPETWIHPRHGPTPETPPQGEPPLPTPAPPRLAHLLALIEAEPAPFWPISWGGSDGTATVREVAAVASAWQARDAGKPLTVELQGPPLNADPGLLADFCDEMPAQVRSPLLRLRGDLALDLPLSEEICTKMLRAGFFEVSCRLGSASARVRRAMRLLGGDSSLPDGLRAIERGGQGRLGLSLSVDVGWPDETELEHYETVSFLEHYAALGLPRKQLSANCFLLVPEEHPEVFRTARGHGRGVLWQHDGPAGEPEVRCRRLMGIFERFGRVLPVRSGIPLHLLLRWMLPGVSPGFVRAWCAGLASPREGQRPGAEADTTPKVSGDPVPSERDVGQVADERTLRELFRIGHRDALEIRFDDNRAFVQLRDRTGIELLELVVTARDEQTPCYRRTQWFNISLRGSGHTPSQLELANALLDRFVAREQKLSPATARGLTEEVVRAEPPAHERAAALPHPHRATAPEHVVLCHQECDSGLFLMSSVATRTLASFLHRRLDAKRHRLSVLDLSSEATVEAMADSIAAAEPDVVGFSCYVWNGANMLRLCNRLKKRLPRVPILLGGPQVFFDEEDLSRLLQEVPAIDLVVQGEGELALLDYLTTPRCARPAAGTVVQGRPLTDLRALGAPINALFPPCREREPMAFLECARGCRYSCAFCLYHRAGHRLRLREPALVRADLAWAKANGTQMILHGYPYVNDRPADTLARLSLIEGTEFPEDVRHFFAIDYLRVTEPEIEAISRLNSLVDIGVQSTNPEALRIARRSFDARRLEQTLDWCARHDVRLHLEVIAGLPGDTREGYGRTVGALARFGVPVISSNLLVLPGTELYYRRHSLGLRYDPQSFRVCETNTMDEATLRCLGETFSAETQGLPGSPINGAFEEIAAASGAHGPRAAIPISAADRASPRPPVFAPIAAPLPAAHRQLGDIEHLLLCHQQADSDGFRMTPTPTRSLASFLYRRLPGHRLSVLDLHSRATPLAMLEQISTIEPDIIGLSCYVWNTSKMFQLCELLCERLPEVTIVLGGPHLYYDDEDMAALVKAGPFFDLLVQGEGELALLEYLNTPANLRPGRGTIVRGKPLADLDQIEASIQSLFPPSRPNDPMMFLEGMRGCRHRCGYCASCLPERPLRKKSLSSIKKELEWAMVHGTKLVMYGFASLNEPTADTLPRLQVIAETDPSGSACHVFAIDYQTITEEEIKVISAINAAPDIGVQSTNPQALRVSRRSFNKSRLEMVLGWCTKHGLEPSLDLIIGLPGDTLHGCKRTLDYLVGLGFPITAAPLVVLPGTELYLKRHGLGLRYHSETGQLISSATMTEDELIIANAWAREAKNATPSFRFDIVLREIHAGV